MSARAPQRTWRAACLHKMIGTAIYHAPDEPTRRRLVAAPALREDLLSPLAVRPLRQPHPHNLPPAATDRSSSRGGVTSPVLARMHRHTRRRPTAVPARVYA